MSIEYHKSELSVALDPSNPAWALPKFLPRHKRILDVGCGIGQSLIAAHFADDVEAYGIDRDKKAIDVGRKLVPPSVKLVCAKGEELPFQDKFFDMVFSRVALPYANIDKALHEISRVLKNDGDVWLMLHPASAIFSAAKNAAMLGDIRGVLSWGYVLVNGALFNTLGLQISLFGNQETFQTVGGITRAMQHAGLRCHPVRRGRHFIVEGQKPPLDPPAAQEFLERKEVLSR